MGQNIFEGVKFGDRFITRNNKLAIFIRRTYNGNLEFIYQPNGSIYSELTTTSDGYWFEDEENDLDVVAKYTEQIDEDKLDELAKETWTNRMKLASANHVIVMWDNFIDGFKTGYRKAKEE